MANETDPAIPRGEKGDIVAVFVSSWMSNRWNECYECIHKGLLPVGTVFSIGTCSQPDVVIEARRIDLAREEVEDVFISTRALGNITGVNVNWCRVRKQNAHL